jgi:hypothetical protein
MEEGDCNLCFERLENSFETFACECTAMFHSECLLLLSSRHGGTVCPYCKHTFKQKPAFLSSQTFHIIPSIKQPSIIPRPLLVTRVRRVSKMKSKRPPPLGSIFPQRIRITEETPLPIPDYIKTKTVKPLNTFGPNFTHRSKKTFTPKVKFVRDKYNSCPLDCSIM